MVTGECAGVPGSPVQGARAFTGFARPAVDSAAMPRVAPRAAPGTPPPGHRAAIGVLSAVHVLGILGAPFAAKLHLWQAGATAHQNFHVIWEACKYATASLLALALVLGPVARGERWARRVLGVATVVMFGGVFFSHAITRGGPVIDFWAYGSFLVVSLLALAVLGAGAGRAGAPR